MKVFHNTSSWNPQQPAELVPEFEKMLEVFLGYFVLDVFIFTFGAKSAIILRTVLVSIDTCSFGLQFKKAFCHSKFSKDLLVSSVSVC